MLVGGRTLVSPSGVIEVKWPSRLGGRWRIFVNGHEALKGIRWPGTRRSRTFIWALDAGVQVYGRWLGSLVTAAEFALLSGQAGEPAPEDAVFDLPPGPPTDAALDYVTAQGWSDSTRENSAVPIS